jgi:hypothetical protein
MSVVIETFFTAVGCMDGRVQGVVAAFGREKFSAEYPDTITEAGIVGKLALESGQEALLDSVKLKVVDVSLAKHHSAGIVVHGHAECAGNPVPEEKQRADIQASVVVIRTLVRNAVPVVGVFVKRNPKVPSEWVAEPFTD